MSTQTTASSSASSSTLPRSFSQLKYAVFSWPNNSLTKRDPIARAYFRQNVTMTSFNQLIGGFPLNLYEGALGPDSPTELFLGNDHYERMINGLAESMGPTRAKQTWRKEAIHSRARLEKGTKRGSIIVRTFADQAALEERFGELKRQNDVHETRHHFQALTRAREVVQYLRREENDVEATFIAIDIETWERDHDIVTEVGFAKSVVKGDTFLPMAVRHFVVEENAKHRNGRYCPDARDFFHFGASETLPTESLVSLLKAELLTPSTPVFLLLHDHRSDLKSLQLLGLSTTSFAHSPLLPHPTSSDGTMYTSRQDRGKWILDTQHLYSGFSRIKKQVRLENACKEFNISLNETSGDDSELGGTYKVQKGRSRKSGKGSTEKEEELAFHNSGNDAWATLRVFWKMMEQPIEQTEV